ncbi:hypothetical protein EI94DRAFT_1800891 [Lactarius quietus]|nr:hypothetical protein EI94DRAFT_1800891 [Lactarius quietus]
MTSSPPPPEQTPTPPLILPMEPRAPITLPPEATPTLADRIGDLLFLTPPGIPHGFMSFDPSISNHARYGDKILVEDGTMCWPHYIKFSLNHWDQKHYVITSRKQLGGRHPDPYGWNLEAAPFHEPPPHTPADDNLNVFSNDHPDTTAVDISLFALNNKGVTANLLAHSYIHPYLSSNTPIPLANAPEIMQTVADIIQEGRSNDGPPKALTPIPLITTPSPNDPAAAVASSTMPPTTAGTHTTYAVTALGAMYPPLTKTMELTAEEVGEDEEQDKDGIYEPEEYDPAEPDLELQYLVSEAHLMEMEQELEQELTATRQNDVEQELFNWQLKPLRLECPIRDPILENDDWIPLSPKVLHMKIKEIKEELSLLPQEETEKEWQPVSPEFTFSMEDNMWHQVLTPPSCLGK